MSNGHIEVTDVLVDFKDVYGQTITDDVEIKIYNVHVPSLKQIFDVKFVGEPILLRDVPAFPTGNARMVVTPTKYRFKQRLINVQAGEIYKISENFFVDPSHGNPYPIALGDVVEKTYGERLTAILAASAIDNTRWNALHPQSRATILNLAAKMSVASVKDGTKLIEFVNAIDRTWLDLKHRERIYARAQTELLTELRNYPEIYTDVGGGTHKFPPGWSPMPEPNSFKTLKDPAGNIQLTFARSADGALLADIDLDDHKGLKHVADYLKHVFTGKDTHPYDIHEILQFFQSLDAEYRLL